MTLGRKVSSAVLVLLLAACGEGAGTADPGTAARLVLTPDASSGSEAALVARLARLEVIVDAEGGLAGIDAAGPLPGGGTAVDWDADGELEARFEAKVDGALPVLEIGLSQNASRDLTFRVIGYGSEDAQVVGQGLATARVARGEVRRVGTPFSLAPWARPPRVVMLRPADGSKVPGLISAVTAVLSTAVDVTTVAPAVALTDPSGQPVPIEVVAEEAMTVDGAFGPEQQAVISLTFDPLGDGQHAIRIGPGLVSRAGQRFDQNPATPDEEDPFVSRFVVELTVGGGPGGTPCDRCPEGWGCKDGLPGCVAILDCDEGCSDGYVCDPARGECVADCRPLGFCFAAGERCDEGSGRCLDR